MPIPFLGGRYRYGVSFNFFLKTLLSHSSLQTEGRNGGEGIEELPGEQDLVIRHHDLSTILRTNVLIPDAVPGLETD